MPLTAEAQYFIDTYDSFCVIKAILQAKRLFSVEASLDQYKEQNITPEEIRFWYKTLYPHNIAQAERAIKYMYG
jgi:hypothetical protein